MHSNITNKNIFSCGRDLEAIPWFISHEKKNVLKKYKYAHNLKENLSYEPKIFSLLNIQFTELYSTNKWVK